MWLSRPERSTCTSHYYGPQTCCKSITVVARLSGAKRISTYVSLLYPRCNSTGMFPVVMHVIYVSHCYFVLFFCDHRHNDFRFSVGDSWQRARPGKMRTTVADSKRRPGRGKATFACGTQIPVRSIRHTQAFSIVAKR
jgi:hypothetical protein